LDFHSRRADYVKKTWLDSSVNISFIPAKISFIMGKPQDGLLLVKARIQILSPVRLVVRKYNLEEK